MFEPKQPNWTRDPEKLISELSLAMELKDIERDQKLREDLQDKGSERVLLLVLFVSVIAFLLTLVTLKFAPHAKDQPLMDYTLYAIFGVMMISLVGVLEYLLAKIKALRKLFLVTDANLARIRKLLEEYKKTAGFLEILRPGIIRFPLAPV